MITTDDLKKLERHLNEVQVANFEGNASMAQMVMAQHEALIRILDYLIGKEKLTSIMQDAAKPVSDTCTQILGEIEKIKKEIPKNTPPMLVSNAREGMIFALRWIEDKMSMTPEQSLVVCNAIARLQNGGDL